MKFRVTIISVLIALVSINSWSEHHEVGEGEWIDLFDKKTTYGWSNVGDVTWEVNDGILHSTSGTGGMLHTTSQFSDFELTAKIRVSKGASTALVYRAASAGHPSENGSSIVWLQQPRTSDSEWQSIRVVARGNELEVVTGGGAKVRTLEGTNTRGHIGILFHHNRGATVEVSDVRLRPLGLKPIFNGENLDGWNIIPGKPSKFSVVDGAINITDGPGQIETQELFKDFVLQLDVFSNGEHLNSGVFFRGPPGVFWKGYETQVRNQWRGDDRTQPVDFGTGGNYGNQPAREVITNDKEWFKMTIVSDGNHSAAWVNGYLVSDFLDTRMVRADSNAKEGYVGAAGTIHLQGHDPTTNLSFKNINVQKN